LPEGVSKEVALLSLKVRKMYIDLRSFYESDRANRPILYRVPPRYDGTPEQGPENPATQSRWLRLARWFLANGIEPEEYLPAAFESQRRARFLPEPDHLTSERIRAEVMTIIVSVGRDVRRALRSQSDLAGAAVRCAVHLGNQSQGRALAYVLSDPTVELSALFRYCHASQCRGKAFARIAKFYEDAAVVQYKRAVAAYDKHWRKLLPEGFKEHANRVYERLTGGPRR
jgi:hypothetical protein